MIAGLTRIVRDVGVAEELAQDALVAALEQWPESGIPENPGAWLMATAKHRAIDFLRRGTLIDRKHEDLGREMAEREMQVPDLAAAMDDTIGDDLLRLVFIACHPVLSTEARVALTLRLLGGLTTDEIARAYLVARADDRAANCSGQADSHRSASSLRGSARERSSRRACLLCCRSSTSSSMKDTQQLRGMTGCGPLCVRRRCGSAEFWWDWFRNEAEVHGLVALMEMQASRAKARVSASGEPILLLDQDRGQWDRLLIQRGLAELERAEKLGGMRGPYAIQAAIAACHARAGTGEETDWARIAALYSELGEVAPSPVVELNRAVAVGMAWGPAAGLELVNPLASDPAMQNYHLLPSVRGDLLKKLGRMEEARAEFERAASITRNARERNLLLERARSCGDR